MVVLFLVVKRSGFWMVVWKPHWKKPIYGPKCLVFKWSAKSCNFTTWIPDTQTVRLEDSIGIWIVAWYSNGGLNTGPLNKLWYEYQTTMVPGIWKTNHSTIEQISMIWIPNYFVIFRSPLHLKLNCHMSVRINLVPSASKEDSNKEASLLFQNSLLNRGFFF